VDPYPGWREWVVGLGRPGGGGANSMTRGWGEGSGFERGENGRGCGALL
jgi:hypothetical protein